MDENLEYSLQTRRKFDFYFLALVFTILGLSVQTSQFSSNLQSTFEVVAWMCFLVSGLAGLSRMEWIPFLYASHSELTREKAFVREAKTGRPLQKSGHILPEVEAQKTVEHVESRIDTRTQMTDKIETHGKVKYFLHKWLLVIGLGLLITSRVINLYSSSRNPCPIVVPEKVDSAAEDMNCAVESQPAHR